MKNRDITELLAGYARNLSESEWLDVLKYLTQKPGEATSAHIEIGDYWINDNPECAALSISYSNSADFLVIFFRRRFDVNRFVLLAAFGGFAGMPAHPFVGRVEGFAAVRGDSGTNAAHDGRVDADAGNYRLSFG